jgi:hypothetical protein
MVALPEESPSVIGYGGTTGAGAERVAIVGCGFTGTSALWQLVNNYPVREIAIFERSGCFGPGYPYMLNECPDYLLNSRTDTLGIIPGNRRAFLQWLSERGHAGTFDAGGYRPRREFGTFLVDVVREAVATAARKGITVRLIPAEINCLRETSAATVELNWNDGALAVDAVILATGRCPDAVPDGLASPRPATGYFASHIDCAALASVPLDATCYVLGASLSAYDVVNRLFSPDTGCHFAPDGDSLTFVAGPNQRRVVLCSRSARLKKVQSLEPMRIKRTRLVPRRLETLSREGRLTLRAVAELASEEAGLHGAAIDWSGVLDPYRGCGTQAALNERAAELLAADLANAVRGGTANFLVDLLDEAQLFLWDAFAARWLPPGEEHTYRSTVEPALLTYSAPCPVPTAQRLLALMRAGRVTIRQKVSRIEQAGEGAAYCIHHRFGDDTAEFLINATNAVDRRVNSARQGALVASMRAQGLHRPYILDGAEHQGAMIDMATLRAVGSRSIYVANMFLWGPGFFTSSAFIMATIVERILNAIYHRPITGQIA